MTDESTVVDILNQLTSKHPNLFWTMRCIYCDGLTEPVHELILYHRQGEKYSKKIIAFQLGSGTIRRGNCQGMTSESPGNIVDYLLDWMNEERLHLI